MKQHQINKELQGFLWMPRSLSYGMCLRNIHPTQKKEDLFSLSMLIFISIFLYQYFQHIFFLFCISIAETIMPIFSNVRWLFKYMPKADAWNCSWILNA